MKNYKVLAVFAVICLMGGCVKESAENLESEHIMTPQQAQPESVPTESGAAKIENENQLPDETVTPDVSVIPEGFVQSTEESRLPAWKLAGEVCAEGTEQYLYYNEAFTYADAVLPVGDKLLFLRAVADEPDPDSWLHMSLFDPERNEIIKEKDWRVEEEQILSAGITPYPISFAGTLSDGRFYVYHYETALYEIFDENLEYVGAICANLNGNDPGKLTMDGKVRYYADEVGQVFCVGMDSEEKLVYENTSWSSAYVTGIFENGRYLEIQYYAWEEEDVPNCTAYLDLMNGEVVKDLIGTFHAELSPDGKKCLLQQTSPKRALSMYRADTGEHLCDLKLETLTEAYDYAVDWEAGFCLATSRYHTNRGEMLAEIKAYGLEDGEQRSAVVQHWPGSGYSTSYSGLLESGVCYNYVEASDGTCGVELWDYRNAKQKETRECFVRYGILSDELLAFRNKLEEKYGIFLYIGNEIASTSFDYTCVTTFDEKAIYRAFEVLENVLALYPADFFDQLKAHDAKTLGIYFAGTLQGKYANTLSYAGGFTLKNGYERSLVVDIHSWDLQNTFVHEIAHWVDQYIDECEMFENEFSYYSSFAALNPDDFEYAYNYDTTDKSEKYIYDPQGTDTEAYYFIDAYSQTYLTEDSARCFEYMLAENGEKYRACPQIRKKMECIASYVRRYFDTQHWPAQTTWEKMLAEAAD